MENQRFWVFDWFDALNLDTESKVLEALRSRAQRIELADAAAKVGSSAPGKERSEKISLVAGRGVDVAGRGQCHYRNCMIRQVDDLFRHAWHYFDRLIVDDLSPILARISQNDPYARRLGTNWLLTLHYARSIGAEALLEFVRKPSSSQWGYKYLSDLGLADFDNTISDLARNIAKEGKHSVFPADDGSPLQVRIKIETPTFGSYSAEFDKATIRGKSANAIRFLLAREWMRSIATDIAADIFVARSSGAPLAARGRMQEYVLSALGTPMGVRGGEDSVAFHLELPVFDDVPLSRLIEFRQANGEVFRHFQRALRASLGRVLRESNAFAPSDLAERVKREVIDPEIARLNAVMARNRGSLVTGCVQVGIGAVITAASVAELVGHSPQAALATALGTAAVTASAGFVANSLTRRESIEDSNMYFLFHASRELHSGH